MIPDGFQYFLDDFWHFQHVHQIWTFTPLSLCRNASQDTRKTWKRPLQIFSIFHHFGNPTFLKRSTLPGIQQTLWLIVIVCFCVFPKCGGSKNSLSQGIHGKKEFQIMDSWIFWKSENWKAVNILISPKYENISSVLLNQTYFGKSIDFLWII